MAKVTAGPMQGVSGAVGDYVYARHGDSTYLRRRAGSPGSSTPKQLTRRSEFGQLAHIWAQTGPMERQKWALLGAQMPDWDGTRSGRGLSGYLAFQSVLTYRLSVKNLDVDTVPVSVDLPPGLPAVTVSAFYGPPAPILGSSDRKSAAPSFSLTLTSTGYPCAVQVWACKPLLPMQPVPNVNRFSLLCTLPALPSGAVDVGKEFAARFGPALPGSVVAVRLVAVSAAGFRGPALPAQGPVENSPHPPAPSPASGRGGVEGVVLLPSPVPTGEGLGVRAVDRGGQGLLPVHSPPTQENAPASVNSPPQEPKLMPHIDNEVLINAPLPTVYALAKDVEAFPSFMPDVESVVVKERSPDGSRTLTDWVGVASDFKLKVRWTEEDLWDDSARTCRFSQTTGDYTSYGGLWTFTDAGNGQTRFQSSIDYELDIPLIGPLLKKVVARLMQANTQTLLEAVKARAEETGTSPPVPLS